jgi:small subunit ribosomal protein S4
MERKKSCKICRRLGVKLFLKGEKCSSPKCPFIKRPYPPGLQRAKKKKPLTISEYGEQLKEKQKLKRWYNLSEKQLKNLVKEALKMRKKVADVSEYLLKNLEMRLENVVFRAGFGDSRRQARQLISHKFFLVNKKPVNLPNYKVKVGDEIEIKENKKKKQIVEQIKRNLKKKNIPSWLEVDEENLKIKVKKEPEIAEISPPADLHTVFEFYSR